MRGVVSALGLAVIWVLLWGSASFANVMSGLLVGTVLVLLVPGLRARPAERYRMRPVAFLRFVGHVLWQTVEANYVLSREVLTRGSGIRTAVVGVPLPGCSDELLTLISNVLALTPGTMPLELDQDPNMLYVHVLHFDDVESVRRDILRLTDLAVRALGSPEAVAAQDELARAAGRPPR